jgi:hypothetical protein
VQEDGEAGGNFQPPMNPEELTEALRSRLPGSERHCGIALAQPLTASERAWRLIGLAEALRHRPDHDEALKALDAAVAREPEPRALRAAYACAITVHRDRGDYAAARRISRSMP